jgi:acyl-CoA synthetase (AMP-forming)/AMP-acid ligase II
LPAPVNKFRIVDANGLVSRPGAIGELQVAGASLFPGYWHNPEATKAAFDGEWFRTGDLATADSEGFVTIVDRLKDIIIRGGENISSVELENALIAHLDVLECAVIGRAHPLLGEEPVAFVVLAPGARTTDDIAANMLAKLGRQKAPVGYYVVDEPLPRNAAGKVAKQVLRSLATAAQN